jgi:hypothetical protein
MWESKMWNLCRQTLIRCDWMQMQDPEKPTTQSKIKQSPYKKNQSSYTRSQIQVRTWV